MCIRDRMYAVTGPSGCGKTTFLSVLGGLDVPTEGEVLFDGEKVTDLEKHRREHVSFVFQTYNLIDYMTPIENVKLTAKSDPVEMLEKLGLDSEEIKRNVLKLSGGQQQRVAIARALASETPVILAEDVYKRQPTGNLEKTNYSFITVFVEEPDEINRVLADISDIGSVSYTHLDVYKRQAIGNMARDITASIDDIMGSFAEYVSGNHPSL